MVLHTTVDTGLWEPTEAQHTSTETESSCWATHLWLLKTMTQELIFFFCSPGKTLNKANTKALCVRAWLLWRAGMCVCTVYPWASPFWSSPLLLSFSRFSGYFGNKRPKVPSRINFMILGKPSLNRWWPSWFFLTEIYNKKLIQTFCCRYDTLCRRIHAIKAEIWFIS